MNKKIILLTVFMILLAPSVLSLGITPGKITLDFEPNLETTITLTVLNNNQKDFATLALVEGDLKDYVTLDKTRLEFAKEDGSKTLSYKIKLPENLDKPGTHQTMIRVKEVRETAENEPISIGATLEVISLLLVNVPYKGKFVNAEMFVSEGKIGEEETIFAIAVENLGEENIDSISAKIDIYSDDDRIETIYTDEKSINSRNKRELVARWAAKKPGKYKAVALVNYDGKTTTLTKEFTVEGFLLKLHDITVKNFKLGGIAKFQILVENIGANLIKEAHSEMNLKDEKGQTVMDIGSNRKDIKPDEKKELEAYWETGNVEKGSYDGSITLKYEDKQTTKQVRTNVKDDAIETQILTTGMVVTPITKPKSNAAITVLIIVLISLNIGWFVYFKKRKS